MTTMGWVEVGTMGLTEVPLGQLVPTKLNRRRVNLDGDEFKDLVDSIGRVGQRQPGIGRWIPGTEQVELLTGRRRWEALDLLQRTNELPSARMLVIIRDLDDDAALEEVVLENMHRHDLSPLEEALAVEDLRRVCGDDLEVAAKLGWPLSRVARRSKLLDLTEGWRRAVDAGEVIPEVAALEVVARYDAEVQGKLLAEVLAERWQDAPVRLSREEADGMARSFHHDLGEVIWDLEDAALVPRAGACTVCPKRSGAQPLLFDALETGGRHHASAAADVCLDPTCFAEKRRAVAEAAIALAARKVDDPAPLLVAQNRHGLERLGIEGVASSWEFERGKKGQPDAVAAVDVSEVLEGKPARVVWLLPRTERAAGAAGEPKRPATLEEKREGLHKRRLAVAAGMMRDRLERMTPAELLPDTVAAVARERELLRLVLALGCSVHSWNYEVEWANDVCDGDARGLHEGLTETDDPEEDYPRAREAAAISIIKELGRVIAVNGPMSQAVDDEFEPRLRWVVGLTAVVWDDLWAAAVAEVPEPKAWAKLASAPPSPPPPPSPATDSPPSGGKRRRGRKDYKMAAAGDEQGDEE